MGAREWRDKYEPIQSGILLKKKLRNSASQLVGETQLNETKEKAPPTSYKNKKRQMEVLFLWGKRKISIPKR